MIHIHNAVILLNINNNITYKFVKMKDNSVTNCTVTLLKTEHGTILHPRTAGKRCFRGVFKTDGLGSKLQPFMAIEGTRLFMDIMNYLLENDPDDLTIRMNIHLLVCEYTFSINQEKRKTALRVTALN